MEQGDHEVALLEDVWGMGPSKQGQEMNCLVAGAWTDAHSLKAQLEARMLQHLLVLRY